MTDILVRKSDGAKLAVWDQAPSRVQLPGKNVVFPGPDRPLDLGKYYIATASGTSPPFNPDTQKLGAPAFVVDVGKLAISVSWPVRALPKPERDRIAREKNQQAQPPALDQLEAIWAQFDADQSGGKTLAPKTNAMLQRVKKANQDNPKP